KVFPDLYTVETDQYLFSSNMPQSAAAAYINYLDEMYTWMRKAYGLDEETSVWCGKASVYAFKTRDEFIRFEQQFMEHQVVEGVQAYCHHDWERSVIIGSYIGHDPIYFGALLVHET